MVVNSELKQVRFWETFKTIDSIYDNDVDTLCDFLLQPLKLQNSIWTKVNVPTLVTLEFRATDICKGLVCLVEDEMITSDVADILKAKIDETGAYSLIIETDYLNSRVTV